MAKGISIHIGLNSIDPNHYGTDGQLKGCEKDAKAMLNISSNIGYKPILLLTKQATSTRLLSELKAASMTLSNDDVLLVSYAGHGAQIPDKTGDEIDGYDETWCLYDRMLVDDELSNAWSNFKPGVKIIVISDSCHSGTVTRMINFEGIKTILYSDKLVYRCLPPEIVLPVYDKYSFLYDGIKLGFPRDLNGNIQASVLLISGCQDNQLSGDGPENGLFTGKLLQVWANGTFKGSYKAFHQQVLSLMPSIQTPNYYFTGISNTKFEQEIPFSLNGSLRSLTNDADTDEKDNGKVSWKIELEDKTLCKLDEKEMIDYLRNIVISPMIESYQQYKILASQLTVPTRGGEAGCEVKCDTKGNCEVKCGGSIRW